MFLASMSVRRATRELWRSASRKLALAVLVACLAGLAFSAIAGAANFDVRGEWEFTQVCNGCNPETLHGVMLVETQEADGTISGTAEIEHVFKGTASGTVSEGKLQLKLAVQTFQGEVKFTLPEATIDTGTSEFSGAGYFETGSPSGSMSAKRLRTLQQIEEEKQKQQEKEKFEREGREQGEIEGREIGEKEGLEKGEKEGRAKGEAEGKAKAEAQAKVTAEREAGERQAAAAAGEAKAKSEREAREKAEKEAAEKATTQAREKVEHEAREKVEKELREKAAKESARGKGKKKHKKKHGKPKNAKRAAVSGR